MVVADVTNRNGPAKRPRAQGATRRAPVATAAENSRLPAFDRYPAVMIEDVWPEVDAGRYPVKRIVGDVVDVWADVFREGHDQICARVLYRHESEPDWRIAPMRFFDNDRWTAGFTVDQLGRYRYTVEAYTDVFGSWAADLEKRLEAGQDVTSELKEGVRLVQDALGRATGAEHARLEELLAQWEAAAVAEQPAIATTDELARLMADAPDLADITRYQRELEVVVDRERAGFAAWYEIFPRSQGIDPARGATFREAEARLPAIAEMGFDVVYMTPIHPIGHTKRKGPNNSLDAGPNDPGSPYAIGSEAGGHEAVAPELGTLEDFLHFQQVAQALGMELALDFAIQVSPDHPWVREHPDWFYHRPDGTIKYAENPPKKYEDIYPLNFRSRAWKEIWAAHRDLVLLWAERGVRIFRVDNPHTKPVAFWEWLIREVQSVYPDVIFLAEAFTRPKMMRTLAKAGFTQSYTYFTWRNTKAELTEYLTELTRGPMREYYRGNFFVNTPDILSHVLQLGGRAAFRMRLVLAATLSSIYGIYNGFELVENTPRGEPGTTEYYQDSEMYQYKVWDWDRPGNIVDEVTRINRIRRENPALHLYDNLRFCWCENDQLLVYYKASPDRRNVILVVVNLDPFAAQAGWLDVPVQDWGLGPTDVYGMHDLLTDDHYTWHGSRNWVRLDPATRVAHVLRVDFPVRG